VLAFADHVDLSTLPDFFKTGGGGKPGESALDGELGGLEDDDDDLNFGTNFADDIPGLEMALDGLEDITGEATNGA
jgi:hypothetical protein